MVKAKKTKKKKGCKHNQLKRKLITEGKGPGKVTGYCSQQCKKMVEFVITKEDILEVYPKGRPND